MFWHPVTNGNRVAARRGGKQPEVNDQSVTPVNSIRPTVVVSLHPNGEAQVTHGPERAASARGSGKLGVPNPRMPPGRRGVVGDRMIGRFDDMTQGDLTGAKAGVHAPRGAEEPAGQESQHP